MCGLSGVLHHDGRPVDRRVLEEMSDCLRHRGPDDTGLYVEHGLGLSQTRLSIIDLSDRGHQPMASPDGRHVITYNGEVYNFQEIGERLRSLGHRFRGDSDTEVVLHAYMEWGTEAFEILEGMFSMAIWDRDLRSLTLVRDRYGINPLPREDLKRTNGIYFAGPHQKFRMPDRQVSPHFCATATVLSGSYDVCLVD